MQYILTESELKNLIPLEKHTDAIDELKIRLKKAENLILDKNNFGCIHDYSRYEYCNDCPLGINGINICTKDKNYSQ